MQTSHSIPQGLWLPLITPFRDDHFDEVSARRLAAHYAGAEIDGFILAATTGEGLTLDDDEIQHYVEICRRAIAEAGRAVQLCLGVSGSDTRKVAAALRTVGGLADRRLPDYLPVLHAAVAARLVQAFHRVGGCDRQADDALQHSLSHRRQSRATRPCCGLPSIRTSSA